MIQIKTIASNLKLLPKNIHEFQKLVNIPSQFLKKEEKIER
jgi:hypothetical protein